MNLFRTKIVAFFFGLITVFALLVASVIFVASDKGLYKDIQVKLQIADYAGCSQGTLDYATSELINYMNDEREDLDIDGVIFNMNTKIFNEKEMAHMVDVKKLYQTGKNVVYISLILMMLLFIFEITTNREAFNYKFFASASITMVLVLVGFIFIGAYAAFDFNSFWMSFHKVFFTNDLYLLDPNTDFLIRMMPLEFFISIVTKIAIKFAILYVSSLGIMIFSHCLLKGSKCK